MTWQEAAAKDHWAVVTVGRSFSRIGAQRGQAGGGCCEAWGPRD